MKHKSKKPKIDFDTPPPAHDSAFSGKDPKTDHSEDRTEADVTAHEPTQAVSPQAEATQNVSATSESVSENSSDLHAEPHAAGNEANDESNNSDEKVKIDFPFSYLIRDRVPKVFDVAETAATQWKNNAKFENLGVDHPVAEIALVKVLEKAKDVERKLEEKGILSAAKMGIQVAKFQAEEIVKKIKK